MRFKYILSMNNAITSANRGFNFRNLVEISVTLEQESIRMQLEFKLVVHSSPF